MVNEAWPTRHSCHVFHTFTITYASSASGAATAGGVDSLSGLITADPIPLGVFDASNFNVAVTSAEIRCLKYPGPFVPPKPLRGTSRFSGGTPSKYSTLVALQFGCSIHTDPSLRFNKKSQVSMGSLPAHDWPVPLAA